MRVEASISSPPLAVKLSCQAWIAGQRPKVRGDR